MNATAPHSPISVPHWQKLPRLLAWTALQRASGSEPPGDGALTAPSQQPAAPGSGKKSLRILIIEDNRDYADSLEVYLELMGHEATVAYSGTEGVEAALRHPPDVVICDIGLPGMDGFEIARTLRQNPTTANACLIAVTGYGSEQDRQYSAECGFNAHLVKPVEASEILKLIDPEPGSTASA